MKQVKFFPTLSLAAVIFFSSCNSKSDKKADENKMDSTGTKTETTVTPAAGPSSVMIIRHQVADYAKWKVGYDGHDSAEDLPMVCTATSLQEVSKKIPIPYSWQREWMT